jgi:hypothetical protein
MLALESDLTTPQLDFYARIVDHGVRRGDTEQIIVQWRRPVVSRVALDLRYWLMPSAPYQLIRMITEMACKAGACFPSLMLCLAEPLLNDQHVMAN